MLTDVFFRRYEDRPLFATVGPKQKALFVQAYRIINEQIWAYRGKDKKVDETVKATWTVLHDRLTMELGIKDLSVRQYPYEKLYLGRPATYYRDYDMNTVVERWLSFEYTEDLDADVFAKRRLSFIELAFREREAQVAAMNAGMPQTLQTAAIMDARVRARGVDSTQYVDIAKSSNETINRMFAGYVHELNTRFEQAAMPLHYHNGYLQIKEDAQVQLQIEQPFWDLVKDPKWVNVSTDMADAIDRRDTRRRGAPLHAAMALESVVKIISDEKGWSTGNEKGASNYLDNLGSKANGHFISSWERELMKKFVSEVRNDVGHGPGSEPMPEFSAEQDSYIIEFCMSSIKSLIDRL